jgi:hypothetical protein
MRGRPGILFLSTVVIKHFVIIMYFNINVRYLTPL